MTVSTVVCLRAMILVYILHRNTAATAQYLFTLPHSRLSTSSLPLAPRNQRIVAEKASCSSSSRFCAGKSEMASLFQTSIVEEHSIYIATAAARDDRTSPTPMAPARCRATAHKFYASLLGSRCGNLDGNTPRDTRGSAAAAAG